MLKKKLKKTISIFQWLLTAVLVLVVLLLIFTTFNPIKSFQIFRVMSGSMEPAIKVGSVAFVRGVKPEILKEDDVITYTSLEDPNMSITHRLIASEEKEGQTVFKTRGDANNAEDIAEVSPSQVKGKVIFSLPFLGYLSVWIRKPLGFGLLVILPALLIIISEILNIKKTIEKEVEKKYAKQEQHPKSKPINLLLIFFLLGIGFFQIKPTNAYFSDVVVIEGNTFSMADAWPPPPPPVAGSVVINELMWMGSANSEHLDDDEWLELRNTTGSPVNLTGWKIDGAGSGSDSITLSGTILANGYFLISHFVSSSSAIKDAIVVDQVIPGISLVNTGEQLTLKSATGVTIDQTPSGAWAAGEHTPPIERSMERNDDPTTGWHTCINVACNDTTYWDVEGNNYGTPKAANLSENDSTSPDYVAPTVTPTPTSTPTVTSELSSESSASPSATTVEPTPTPSPTLETSPTSTPTAEPSLTLVPSTTPTPSPSPEPNPEVSPTPTPEPSNMPNPTPTPTAESPANEPPADEPPADGPPKEPQIEEQPQNQTPLPEEGSEINE